MSRSPCPGPLLSAALSATLVASAMRPWGLGYLAWLAYVPGFAAVATAPSARRAALLAAVSALGVTSVGYEAAVGIGPLAYPLAVLLAVAPFAAAGAVAWLVSGRLAGPATRARLLVWCLVPLWSAAEFLPAQPGLFGVWALPLAFIGYSQADLPAMQLARISSVTATSLVLLCSNAALTHSLVERRWRPLALLLPVLALTGAAWLSPATDPVTSSALPPGPSDHPSPAAGADQADPNSTSLRVRLVQPNLPDAAYSAARALVSGRQAVVDRLKALSVPPNAAATDAAAPGLILWPEAAWPDLLQLATAGQAGGPGDLAGLGPLIFGAASGRGASSETDPAAGPARGREPAEMTNAVLFWDGTALHHLSDKRRLIPLAESHLTAGRGPVSPLAFSGRQLAALVCYDAAFPDLVRAAERAGADLIVVLSDDSFAAAGNVPTLHLRLAAFRAVESGLPLMFVSTTGPSAVIAPSGRQVATLASGVAGYLDATAPNRAAPTPYSRHGDWLGVGACLVSFGLATAAVRKGGAPLASQPPTRHA